MRGFVLALLLLMLPAGAQAVDPDLPLPDPPGVWRKLTHDDATTDSRCIGDPKTPLCAIETYFACFLRREPDYCDIVGAGVRPLPQVGKALHEHEEYRIVYARRPSKLDPLDPATEGTVRWQPGDVLVGFMWRACWNNAGKIKCEIGVEDDPLFVYILRKTGDDWVFAGRFRPRF
jgi:hypothetical protein